MARRVLISCASVTVSGMLLETPTADRVWHALPLTGRVERWGGEVTFKVSLSIEREEAASQVVEPGTLCYWCEGESVTIPFGPTPISLGDECRLVAAANAFGRLDEEWASLADIVEGDTIEIRRQT